MNACTDNCGNCGRCDDYEPIPTVEACFFCNEPLEDSGHWPYCGSLCAAYAERDSMEDLD